MSSSPDQAKTSNDQCIRQQRATALKGEHFMNSTLRITLVAGTLSLLAAASFGQVKQVNLVSDQAGVAAVTDANLVNPWGIAFSATSPLWIADNGTALSTLYQNTGAIVPLVVSMPPGNAPTGTVFNGGTGFVVSSGTK